ncbi:MAG: hypothetical protein LKE53_00385 [Oscillospiraceae bacterium]|jgi:predicted ABC-type exoprotein transport system permease subunit|nr:hypothetical protein [Oscillospiraceae bacterium]
MKKRLRIVSIVFFCAAVPVFFPVNLLAKGCGLLASFWCLTFGLLADQIMRLRFPKKSFDSPENYRHGKTLTLVSFVLFMQAPMIAAYGCKLLPNVGVWLAIVAVCLGLGINFLSGRQYPYKAVEF